MNIMKVNSVSENLYQVPSSFRSIRENVEGGADVIRSSNPSGHSYNPSFTGGENNFNKRFWHIFKKMSDYFKESDEIVSQIIQFIGTAAIAPFAILVSPSRGEAKKLPEKEQKEKKLFQALRQPVSAVLAISFMYPFTTATKKIMNYLAFEKRSKLFNNVEIESNGTKFDFGNLITSKSYLTKKINKQLKKNGVNEDSISRIKGFDGEIDLKKLREELKDKLRNDYKESGLEISEEKLSKQANKKFRKFVSEKIAGMMREKELAAKVEEFSKKENLVINDIDLVTDKYQKLMKNDYSEEFAKLKQDAKINIWDELIDSWGIKTKRMQAYKEASDRLAKEKGLEYLRKAEPDMFRDPSTRLRNFVENIDKEAQRVFKRKTDLIPLGVNIFAFAVSCLVLNWLHPKFADFVDGIRQAKAEEQTKKEQKVEVAA